MNPIVKTLPPLSGIVVGTLVLIGCGDAGQARLDVARARIIEQVDQALGRMEVEKSSIIRGIKASSEAIAEVRRAKAKADAGAELLGEKVDPFEEIVSRCDAALARIRDSVDSDGKATLAGTTVQGPELAEMTTRIIASRKDAAEQAKAYRKARDDMRASASGLGTKLSFLEKRVASLKAMMTRVDVEMTAATAMKRASEKIGGGAGGLADNLADLGARVAALGAEARSMLEGEAGFPESGSKGLEEALAAAGQSKPVQDPISDIERILGPLKK